MTNPTEERVIGDEAWRRREAARRRSEWLIQGAAIAVVAAFVWMLSENVSENLAARHIRSGFAFLFNSAGFDIGESLVAFQSTDAMWHAFVVGMVNTIRVSIFSVISALILGVLVGLMRLAEHPILRALGTAHVEIYRNIPLIIQLFAIYLVITELLPTAGEALHFGQWALLSKAGLQVAVPREGTLALVFSGVIAVLIFLLVRDRCQRRMTELMASLSGLGAAVVAFVGTWIGFGVVGGWSKPFIDGFAIEGGAALSPEFLALWLGLTLFTSASIAEIVRAGVLAVPRGQWNGALSLGMTKTQVISYIVFPQSMRLAIPPLASQFMNLTKNSSLAVVIGYPDLVAVGNMSINSTGQALEVIVIIMAVYLVLNLIISVCMNALNARVLQAPR